MPSISILLAEIHKLLSSLNTTKAAGPDAIKPVVLKTLKLPNSSYLTGHLPTVAKQRPNPTLCIRDATKFRTSEIGCNNTHSVSFWPQVRRRFFACFRFKYDEVQAESFGRNKAYLAIRNVLDRNSSSQRKYFFRGENCFSYTKTENICLVFEYCFASPPIGMFGIFQKHSLFHSSSR